MKKIAVKLLLLAFLLLLTVFDIHGQIGVSISYSIGKTLGTNILGSINKNSFYIGYSKQYNGQKNTVVRERKKTYGTTPIEDGDFYWLVDMGYSRTFFEKITIQPEISIGRKNYFTSYKDNRFKDNGYSLITSSERVYNYGINLGYIINETIEPYCGYHNLKKITFGIRVHINLLE